MSKLFYHEKTVTGIDIGQTAVKAMAIDTGRGEVTCYGSVDVDPEKMQAVLAEGQTDYLAERLGELLAKLNGPLPSRVVAVSIPAALTYTRLLNVPAAAEKSLKSAVELEAEQYIPVPTANLNIDYEIIRREGNSLQVLVCAAPKTLVGLVTAALGRVNLTPAVVEPSLVSVTRLLRTSERALLPSIVLDIGAVTTDIAAIDNGSIRVTASLPIGGNSFTLSIAHALDVTLEQAHQLKVLHGLNVGDQQDSLRSALAPDLDAVVGEVKKLTRYYNDRLAGTKLEQLLVVGSGANMPGIGEYFTNALVTAARVANPWQSLNFGRLTAPSRTLKPRFLTVAGAASASQSEIWGGRA